jgi:hypothetical protein
MKIENLFQKLSTALILAIPALVIFLFTGCGHQTPTAPDVSTPNSQKALAFIDSVIAEAQPPSGPANGPAPILYENLPFFECASEKSVVVESDVSTNLNIALGDKTVEFNIPRGAVDDGTEIEITGYKFDTPYGEVWLYECGPSGLVFKEPLQVVQPINKPDGESVSMIFIDECPDGYTFKLEQVTTVESGRAVFFITHFSKYAIS